MQCSMGMSPARLIEKCPCMLMPDGTFPPFSSCLLFYPPRFLFVFCPLFYLTSTVCGVCVRAYVRVWRGTGCPTIASMHDMKALWKLGNGTKTLLCKNLINDVHTCAMIMSLFQCTFPFLVFLLMQQFVSLPPGVHSTY
jgi:hypothetical protein